MKVLVISSTGGGGLLQAAKAKEEEITANDPNTVFVRKDLMRDWFGKGCGAFFAGFYNYAQKTGNVFCITVFGKFQPILEKFFWPKIFLSMFYVLVKEDIDRVIDTQVFSTTAMIKAIRLYNFLKKKNLILEKVMVDLPTNKAVHFYYSIKRCSKKDRPLIRFVTIEPLLQKEKSDEEFWHKYCKLPLKNISYEPYIVRKSFKQYFKKQRTQESMNIEIYFSSTEEKSVMSEVIAKGYTSCSEMDDHLLFHIDPAERVITVLLGSHPSYNGTIGYVKKIKELSNLQSKKTLLFVFCSHFERKKNPLYQDLYSYIKTQDYMSKNLTIIPFSFQKQEIIAKLFHRSDITITRSGGGSAMELLTVSRGKMLIHSEAKSKNPTRKELLKGIPCWESGAAEYLEAKAGANLVTPHLLAYYFN